MDGFRVTWEIEVEKNEADTALDALVVALQELHSMNCPVFFVEDLKTGLIEEFDAVDDLVSV